MTNLDAIRSKALDEMDRARRGFIAALIGAAFFEAMCLTGILLVADLRNNLHLLVVFAVGLVYMPLVMGLIALGAWVKQCTLRILNRLDDAR